MKLKSLVVRICVCPDCGNWFKPFEIGSINMCHFCKKCNVIEKRVKIEVQ